MSDHYDKNWETKLDEYDENIIIYVKHLNNLGICPPAEVSCGGPDDMYFDEDMARAKIMAAAPELLEACQAAMDDEDAMLPSIVDELTAAIAKATQ